MKSIQVRIMELMFKNDDKYTESPELLFKDMIELYGTLSGQEQNEMIKIFENLQSMSKKLGTHNATKGISKVLELISGEKSKESKKDGFKIPKQILNLISELIKDDEESINTEDDNIKLLNKYLFKTSSGDLLLKRNGAAFYHGSNSSANAGGQNYNTLLSGLQLNKAKITKFKPKNNKDLVDKLKNSKAFIKANVFEKSDTNPEKSDINYVLMQINFIVEYTGNGKFISCYSDLDNHGYVTEKWHIDLEDRNNNEYYVIN